MATAFPLYDLAIIGGGINGCGIARDAAGRGHRVLLLEQGDLAQATSSASTKLIHGGLRYLEHYEFSLVRKALIERETLLAMAPHIIWPLRFILPHRPQMRPVWMLRLGLFLYDHLGRRSLLPASWMLSKTDPAHALLSQSGTACFEYSDAWVDDARLVILNAMDARAHGADILTRCRVTTISPEGAHWQIGASKGGKPVHFTAKAIINASGPWADQHLFHKTQPANRLRLVKGSHIVVRKWHDDPRCLILQNDDGRIVFVIPYEQDFCLIGTTDCDYQGDPAEVRISGDEIAYLCEAVSRQCAHRITPDDIVWSYAGVRPLMDDGQDAAQETTRDYHLVKSGGTGQPPLVSVIGGKITTYRVLAQDVMELIEPDLPPRSVRQWTATAPLPGGDFPVEGFAALVAKAAVLYPALPRKLLARLARHYGTCLFDILGEARAMEDLGPCFGADLTAREVDYLVTREWAQTAEDIVWRRSKLGLHFSDQQLLQLTGYLQDRV